MQYLERVHRVMPSFVVYFELNMIPMLFFYFLVNLKSDASEGR